MPFILDNEEADHVKRKREQRAECILNCTNISFVIFAILCIAANEALVLLIQDMNDTVGKFRVFDFAPYVVLVGVLIYSICKIKLIVNENDIFIVSNRLFCSLVFVLITYILTAFHFGEDTITSLIEANWKKQIISIILFILYEFTLMFVVYMMYKFTKPELH